MDVLIHKNNKDFFTKVFVEIECNMQPDGKHGMLITLVDQEGNVLRTPFVFNSLQPGDKVKLRGLVLQLFMNMGEYTIDELQTMINNGDPKVATGNLTKAGIQVILEEHAKRVTGEVDSWRKP